MPLLTREVPIERLLPMAAALALLLMIAAGAGSKQDVSQRQPHDPVIDRWIERLGNDSYPIREDATGALLKIGRRAIPALTKAAESSDAEVRSRVLHVLVRLSHSDDPSTSGPAVAALKALARSGSRAAAGSAKNALVKKDVAKRLREQNAVAKLTGMHAILGRDKSGAVTSCNLAMSPIPKGSLATLKQFTKIAVLDLSGTQITDAELAHLKPLTGLRELQLIHNPLTDAGLVHINGLTDLEALNLFATNVTDAGLVHLKGLTKLKTLKLNATAVTDDGVSELRKALPKTRILH